MIHTTHASHAIVSTLDADRSICALQTLAKFSNSCGLVVELIDPQPGEHVLDLACGTGLVSYPASSAVGPEGSVIGIDISTGMLAQAEAKTSTHEPKNVEFYNHSITDLDTLDALKGKPFDVITCCSALVLLPNPAEALQHWVTYLKSGGRLIVDVTHPQNLTSGIVFERVGVIMEKRLPWYRLNFQGPGDLHSIMSAAGLDNVDIKFMSQLGGSGEDGDDGVENFIRPSFNNPKVYREYAIEDADGIFDSMIDGTPMKALASPAEVRELAREVFREEWAKAADEDGMVREVDGIFMGLGWKR